MRNSKGWKGCHPKFSTTFIANSGLLGCETLGVFIAYNNFQEEHASIFKAYLNLVVGSRVFLKKIWHSYANLHDVIPELNRLQQENLKTCTLSSMQFF
jgi:hypothetical protein